MSSQPPQHVPTPQHKQMLRSARQPQRRPQRHGAVPPEWDWQAALLGLLLVLVLVGLVLAGAWWYTSNWVKTGVTVLGVSVGGKPRAKAIELVEEAWRGWVIEVGEEGQSWPANPPQLGLSLDIEGTVDAALRAGRGVLRGEDQTAVRPIVAASPGITRRYLEELAPRLAVPPGDASLRVVDGHVETVAAMHGRELDVTGTAEWLAVNAEQAVVQKRLPLAFLSVPPVVADVSHLVGQLEGWLANPIAIRAYDPVTDESLWWSAPPEVWGNWLSVDVGPEQADALDWALDEDQVRAYVTGHSEALAPARYVEVDRAVAGVVEAVASQTWDVYVRVYHYPQQHTVQLGETLASIARDYGFPYPWLQEANPGVDALRPDQVISIPSPDVLLPLPIVPGKRIVVSISQQQMWAYEWGALRWAWTVSTGIESSPTSPGVFQVQSHEMNAYAASWDLWMPYFMGIYRPVPSSDFMNGFHGFPTRDGTSLLWTGNLGYPVTYGCILVDTGNAAALYQWAVEGTVVEIRP